MNHTVPGWRSRASAIMSCNARRWGTEERFMRVLVSNDDGVDAPGIQALARGLRAAGHEVLLVAPDRDRSGASNSLTLDAPVRVVPPEPAVWRVHRTATASGHVATHGMTEDDTDNAVSTTNNTTNT